MALNERLFFTLGLACLLSILSMPLHAASASGNSQVLLVVGATTSSSTVTQPSEITIVRASSGAANQGNGRNNAEIPVGGYSSTIVGGCQGATAEGCFSIKTNTNPVVSVPLSFVANRLSKAVGNEVVYFDDQVSGIAVALYQGSNQIGNLLNLSPGASGVITFNMADVDQLVTRNYRIIYRVDLLTSPEDGTYTGSWPITLGTISLINP